MANMSDIQINRSSQPIYGFCPVCGDEGVMRERRMGGNDRCANGHIYPSNQTIIEAGLPDLAALKVDLKDVAAPLEAAHYESLKIDTIRVMNLIEDILYEAQNNPLRLVAFNSPLLGIALLEVWKHKNPNATQEEWRSVHQQVSEFRAVVEANRKRENGI